VICGPDGVPSGARGTARATSELALAGGDEEAIPVVIGPGFRIDGSAGEPDIAISIGACGVWRGCSAVMFGALPAFSGTDGSRIAKIEGRASRGVGTTSRPVV
jgi:hypothetical protein